jgi:exosortase
MGRRTAWFVAYTVCVLAASGSIVRDLVQLAKANATASHTIVIPALTLCLLYQRRRSMFASAPSYDWAGAVIAAFGIGAACAGMIMRAPGSDGSWLSVAVAGLVVSWVGGFVLFCGRRAARAALFPLLFLGFMIPIPTPLLAATTAFLKAGSAKTVAGLLTISGTPFNENGYVFTLPNVVIEIADECSGIRSSIALLLTSLLAGDAFLRKGRSMAVLVAATLPIAIFKNGIRIVTLSLLASHVDPAFLTGELHHEGGVAFFLLVLPIVAAIVHVLRMTEAPPMSRAPDVVAGGSPLPLRQ